MEKLGNPETSKNYAALSQNLSQARKLFSLFKTFSELDKIVKLLAKNKLYEVISLI